MQQLNPSSDSTSDRPLILLAEDDDDLRGSMATWLEDKLFTVIPLEDGFELLDYLALARRPELHVPAPDLIVSDVRMPGKSGLEAVIEARRAAVACPIVLITAFDDDQFRERALQAGATLCLPKPVDLDVLAQVLAGLLPRQMTSRKNEAGNGRAGVMGSGSRRGGE